MKELKLDWPAVPDECRKDLLDPFDKIRLDKTGPKPSAPRADLRSVICKACFPAG